MNKLTEWYKQLQGLIVTMIGIGLCTIGAKSCAIDDTVRDNRRDIDKMQLDMNEKASKEALAEHIASSGEQRRQIELDLMDHSERLRYLERLPHQAQK